jgi:hypothetical protein
MSAFSQHPLPDIGRAVEHSDSCGFACVQETNGVYVHQIHLFQIHSYGLIATIDFASHLTNLLNSESTTQPNSRSAFARNPFDLQRHRVLIPKRAFCDATALALEKSPVGAYRVTQPP